MADQHVPGMGTLGPFLDEYDRPHVYARDVRFADGRCVCGAALGDPRHVQAAPGVDVPEQMRPPAGSRFLGKGAASDQRYVLGVAYQAGPDPRISTGADGHRDYFTPEELEKAAWSFLQDGGGQVGLMHTDGTVGAARAVESYVWRGNDWDAGSGVVIHKGDWLLGVICDEPTWDLVKSGRVTGFSPQGFAKRRKPTPTLE